MISVKEINEALSIRLKEIHAERAVVFEDIDELEVDTTSIEFEHAIQKVAGNGEMLRQISYSLKCYFKELKSKIEILDLADELTEGLGTVLKVGDRYLSFEYESEYDIVDNALQYSLKITYRDILDGYYEMNEMDRQLFRKIEQEKGEKVTLDDFDTLIIRN